MAMIEDTWTYYFYYWYLEGRGPQLLFITDDEVAELADNNPDSIIFASQEEIYPMWVEVEGVMYRVAGTGEYQYYYGYWTATGGKPLLLVASSMNELTFMASNNLKSIIIFGTNEALEFDDTLLAIVKEHRDVRHGTAGDQGQAS